MEFEQGVGYIDMKSRPEKTMQLRKKLVDKSGKLDFAACTHPKSGFVWFWHSPRSFSNCMSPGSSRR